MEKIRSFYHEDRLGLYTREELAPLVLVNRRHREARRERARRYRQVMRACIAAATVALVLGVLAWVVRV